MPVEESDLLESRAGSLALDGSGAAAPPTRVAFVIDNMGLGGTELNAVRTAERLDRKRYDLRVVCLSGPGPLSERYARLGVPVDYLSLRSFYGPSMLTSGWRFVRMLRRERVEVVHAHDVYSNIFASVWARFGRVRAIVASRRWWHSLPNRKLQLANRYAFARADAVLANSPQVARSLREEAGVPESRLSTIANFADSIAFSDPPYELYSNIRRQWGADDDTIVVGCVARFHPVKDHRTLLLAFAQVHATYPRTLLVLVGDGPARRDIETLIAELGIGRAVRMTGELQGRSNLHWGFDISVLSSMSEGFPNSLVEAMAAGNPVVATAVGGNPDAVSDGETGLLVAPGDPQGFSRALERLISDPALRATMGSAGRTKAQNEFTAASVLPKLSRLYDGLIAGALA